MQDDVTPEEPKPIPWAQEELGAANLGDTRLNRRLIKIADDLSKAPLAPINQACGDWGSTKAAYRFFGNEHIDANAILSPHIENTIGRMKNQKFVLAIQDTTMIDYTSHKKAKGLGSIGATETGSRGNVKGLIMHSTLIWSSTNVPLGFLSQEIVSRDPNKNPTSVKYKKLPTEEKESYKWIQALENTVKNVPDGCKAITVCDREGDFYDMFLNAIDLNTDVVIRSCYDRRIEIKNKPDKLSPYISKLPVSLECEIKVPLKKATTKKKSDGTTRKVIIKTTDEDGNKVRTAKIAIRFGQMTLLPPVGSGQIIKEKIKLFIVQAKEIDAPEKFESLEWNLLTTLKISTAEEAISIIKIYQTRWRIECYFKTLKSGCKVEECRLEDVQRLKRFVALSSIIAWRIYWFTFINNLCPKGPVSEVLSELEWKTLFSAIHKTNQAPEYLPNVSEAIIWIARLGGFLARKCDGRPGPTVIWRGWTRLQDMVFIKSLPDSS